MAALVLDRKQKPLMPCSEKRARKLLACGRARVQRPLRDAAAVNSTRWALLHTLKATGLPVSASKRAAWRYVPATLNIQTHDQAKGVAQGISYRYCKLLQRADGHGYSLVAIMDVTGTPPKPGTLRVPRSASPA